MQPLERFVALRYDRTSTEARVKQAKKHLFSKTGRAIDYLLVHSLHSFNTPRELPTRLITFGPK